MEGRWIYIFRFCGRDTDRKVDGIPQNQQFSVKVCEICNFPTRPGQADDPSCIAVSGLLI